MEDKPTYSESRVRKPLSAKQAFAEHGKLTPQAVDIEEAVLGAMMLEKNAIEDVANALKPEMFYKDYHQAIAAAIYELYNAGKPVDILTVTNKLKELGNLELAGGAFYITQLTSRVASSANIEHHAGIVMQKFVQRELIRISNETIRDSFEDTTDVFDLLDNVNSQLEQLNKPTAISIVSASEAIDKAIENFSSRVKLAKQNKIEGVTSGNAELDRLTNGFKGSKLYVIAGRPGMGKTSRALGYARAAALNGDPVAVFTLEMPDYELADKLIMSEFPESVSVDLYLSGKSPESDIEKITSAAAMAKKLPIIIDPNPTVNIRYIKATSRKLKRTKKIKMIVIDYLQLVSSDDERSKVREQEVAKISRSCKLMAKELDLPVLLLCQLNRNVEGRSNREPMLSDLRESGAIEQDADLVFLYYRPSYYGITSDENSGADLTDTLITIIAKHRGGALGKIFERHDKPMNRFTRYNPFEPVEPASNQFPDVRNMPVNNHYEVERNEVPF